MKRLHYFGNYIIKYKTENYSLIILMFITMLHHKKMNRIAVFRIINEYNHEH